MTSETEKIDVANGLLQLAEAMGPLLDVVDGHREELGRRGYSPTASEAMAVEFYRHLIGAMFAAKPGGS